MAKQAGKPRVIAIVVFEVREISRLKRRMSENHSFTSRGRGLCNRVEMTRGRRFAAECDVALRANKRRALGSLVQLVIENSTFIERGCNMATFGAAT